MPGPDGGAGTGASGDAGVVTKVSARSVGDTVGRLLELLEAKGVKVFAVIDQQAEARAVGLDLRETTLVIFGNPAAGTGVMVAAPLAALDLPLKVLVWAEPEPGHLGQLHRPGHAGRRATGSAPTPWPPLTVIDGLTDALDQPPESPRRGLGQPRIGTGVAYSSSK